MFIELNEVSATSDGRNAPRSASSLSQGSAYSSHDFHNGASGDCVYLGREANLLNLILPDADHLRIGDGVDLARPIREFLSEWISLSVMLL
jgi:hypothetical protein